MGDIYNINNWASSTSYNEDDIVINGNYYYYARSKHTSTSNFSTDLSNNLWKGVLAFNGQTKPYFEWIPSYNYNSDITPSVKNIQLGDNYVQTVPNGINNILLTFNLDFNDRNTSQYIAILHFFHTRAGTEQFYFIPPVPFNVTKKFICSNWSITQKFYNNYSIRATFSERV